MECIQTFLIVKIALVLLQIHIIEQFSINQAFMSKMLCNRMVHVRFLKFFLYATQRGLPPTHTLLKLLLSSHLIGWMLTLGKEP
jgi:hypothetical protein